MLGPKPEIGQQFYEQANLVLNWLANSGIRWPVIEMARSSRPVREMARYASSQNG